MKKYDNSSNPPSFQKHSKQLSFVDIDQFIIVTVFIVILICLLWYFKEHGFNYVTGNFMMILTVCFLVILYVMFKRNRMDTKVTKNDDQSPGNYGTTQIQHFYKPGNETVKKAISRLIDFFKASKSKSLFSEEDHNDNELPCHEAKLKDDDKIIMFEKMSATKTAKKKKNI